MTNVNKINGKQKELMAQFMMDHPNLAKNIIPNSAQGKTLLNRLWDELTDRLNSYGPPVKKAVIWRKVFADQKHNAKKKLSFNKESKKKTGGGPYEELVLSPAEEQIIQAAGIDAAVEGVPSVKSFGAPKTVNVAITNEAQSLSALLEDSMEYDKDNGMGTSGNSQKSENMDNQPSSLKKVNSKSETKLNLLTSSLSNAEKYHIDLCSKLDHLIKLKEKSLKLREEVHSVNMATKNLDFQIKTIELELLKKKQAHFE